MPHTLHIIDAFTDKPFHGNPAAVCVLDGSGPCRQPGICTIRNNFFLALVKMAPGSRSRCCSLLESSGTHFL